MAACIKQQPICQWRRIRMMSKDPQRPSSNFIKLSTALIPMKATNIAEKTIAQRADTWMKIMIFYNGAMR